MNAPASEIPRKSRRFTVIRGIEGSDLGKVDAEGLGVGTQTFLLDGFQRSSRDPKVHPTIPFRPPKTTLLQIGLLQFLGANMGVAHRHSVVGTRTGELTHPRHDVDPLNHWPMAKDLT